MKKNYWVAVAAGFATVMSVIAIRKTNKTMNAMVELVQIEITNAEALYQTIVDAEFENIVTNENWD